MNKVLLIVQDNLEYQEIMTWVQGMDFGCEPKCATGRGLCMEYSFDSKEDVTAFLLRFGDKRAQPDLSSTR